MKFTRLHKITIHDIVIQLYNEAYWSVTKVTSMLAFRLLRFFLVTSLIAFCLVAAALVAFVRQQSINDLLTLAERNNVALTQAFVNSLWPQFSDLVRGDEPLADAEIARLNAAVQAQMAQLTVVKVKIYNLDGLTVFSTQASQIGEDKSTNAGFLSARAGEVISELSHRDTFSAFDAEIVDRDLISSYVPVRATSTIVEAVLEVYDDVTPLLQQIEQTQRTVLFGLLMGLGGLYTALFFIVRYADRTIEQQRRERERAEEHTRQARDEAMRALKFKAQILANVSHDARTPLSIISLQAEMMQRGVHGTVNERQQESINTILTSTRQLSLFISTLLDEAQLSAGKFTLNNTAFQPAELLQHISEAMRPFAVRKFLRLETTLDPALPASLVGDPDRLKQILFNLVDNGIKFTTEGRILVALLRHDDSHWALRVSDTGMGISPDEHKDIFDAFWQVDGSSTRRATNGVGLGLSIVKQLTDHMDGDIQLDSRPGGGSTFTIILPLHTV